MLNLSKWFTTSIIFGIIFVSFILWNRLLRIRLPRDLIPLESPNLFSYFILCLAITFSVCFLYSFLYAFKILPREKSWILDQAIRIEEKLSSILIIGKIKKFFVNLLKAVEDGPTHFFVVLYNAFSFLDKVIKAIVLWLFSVLKDQKRNQLLFYTTLIVLPKVLVSSIFCIEVIYYRHLEIFYKLLPMLLIPTIIRAFFGIITFHAFEIALWYEQ